MSILLVGTGPMAVDYAKVLIAQKHSFVVVGRGESSANKFFETTGVQPIVGGLEKFLRENELGEDVSAIIATGTEALMKSLLLLKDAGVSKILIEKPGAISIDELLSNKKELEDYQESIFLAYNRRFYSSVMEAERLIEEDGGLRSMHFEFTEWAHKIEPLEKAPGVKENWFFANSTHVVDLAFFIAGQPADWKAYAKPGKIKWHSKSNFAGAGVTSNEVLFSYISNWESAGRWSVELLTDNRRIYLKPMEEVWVQNKGSIEVRNHAYENAVDKEFKPGLFNQVNAFLNAETSRLIDIKQHFLNAEHIYRKILEG